MARERATDTKALVAAAARTFRDKGYRSSTIDDIALAAGISRPTVYKYTRTKQHLLDLMVEEVTTDLGRKLDEITDSGDPPLDRLRATINAHIAAATANRTFYAIVFSEETELSDESRRFFRSWAHTRTQDFAALLDECIAGGASTNGRRRRLDTRVAAHLLETMLATLYRWYDPEGPVSPERLAEQIWLLVGDAFQQGRPTATTRVKAARTNRQS
jgi:TetR/AcrR family transcriptional regulator, cholesterol catabolism regulator